MTLPTGSLRDTGLLLVLLQDLSEQRPQLRTNNKLIPGNCKYLEILYLYYDTERILENGILLVRSHTTTAAVDQ